MQAFSTGLGERVFPASVQLASWLMKCVLHFGLLGACVHMQALARAHAYVCACVTLHVRVEIKRNVRVHQSQVTRVRL